MTNLTQQLKEEAREKIKELIDHPRTGLKESSDTNKTRMELFGIYDEIIENTAQKVSTESVNRGYETAIRHFKERLEMGQTFEQAVNSMEKNLTKHHEQT